MEIVFLKNMRSDRNSERGVQSCMIMDYFWYEIENTNVVDIMFQEDGVTCYMSGVKLDVLPENFRVRVTSHHANVNWPPRPSDTMSLDFL